VTRVSISSSVLHHECGIELTEKFYKALFSLFTPREVTIKQKNGDISSPFAFFASAKWNKLSFVRLLSLSVSLSPALCFSFSVSFFKRLFLSLFLFLSFVMVDRFLYLSRFLYLCKASSYRKNQSQNHISVLRRSWNRNRIPAYVFWKDESLRSICRATHKATWQIITPPNFITMNLEWT